MIGALGIGQLLGSMLVGTDAIDPVTLFAVAGCSRWWAFPRLSCPRVARCVSIPLPCCGRTDATSSIVLAIP
jgi:hypothetical protein